MRLRFRSGPGLWQIQFRLKAKALRRDDFSRAAVEMLRFALRNAAGGFENFRGSSARKIRGCLCCAGRGSVPWHWDGHVRKIELPADIIERLEEFSGVGEALAGIAGGGGGHEGVDKLGHPRNPRGRRGDVRIQAGRGMR